MVSFTLPNQALKVRFMTGKLLALAAEKKAFFTEANSRESKVGAFRPYNEP